MDTTPIYRGRFAPSPTGPLHFGSLVAALGSYLDAKHHQGTWLIRIEDIDQPRCSIAATADILRTLAAFGLHSDEAVIYQSQRSSSYESAFEKLGQQKALYPCCCTRKEISDSAQHGIDGQIYPGTCRHGMPTGREGRAWRVVTDNCRIEFVDTLQGNLGQNLASDIGDFVVKRADGLFAYQLAVVVDDYAQGITHIVRGCDLLNSTPRQIHLQHILGQSLPSYMHLPIAVNQDGEKLSKQTLARPISTDHPAKTIFHILQFLRQAPPHELQQSSLDEVLTWAIKHWQPAPLRGIRELAETAF
jgi:glutamyl-Q tRNA(Asp) synthetase